MPTSLIPVAERTKMPRFGQRSAFALAAVISVLLVVPPLFLMLWTSLHPGGNAMREGAFGFDAFTELFAGEDFWQIAAQTAQFAGSASLLALALGGVMAWGVARTNMKGKRLIYVGVFLSFAVPGMIEAVGWVQIFGEGAGIATGFFQALFGWSPVAQSMPMIIIVQAFSWAPMVFLLLVGPFKSMDATLEESALAARASRFTVLWRISGPLTAPAILAVLILVLVRAIQAFEMPLFLGSPAGIRTFTTEIYSTLHKSFSPDYAKAAAFGTILVVVLSFGLWLYYRATRLSSKFTTVSGKAFRAKPADLGPWKWVAGAFAVFCTVVWVAPVIAMALTSLWPRLGRGGGFESFTLDNYVAVGQFRGLVDGIVNTLVVSVVSATLATILCLFAAYLIVRTRIRGRELLDGVLSLPIVIPGTVLGLAFLITYLRVPAAIYGTLWIIIFAFIAHYAPYAMRYLQPSLVQISRDLDDASRAAGASELTVFRRILMPLIVPAIIGSWVYVFFHAFKDVSIVAMIYTGNTPVLSTQLLDMWKDGTGGMLNAYGTCMTLGSILIGAVAFRLAKKFGFNL